MAGTVVALGVAAGAGAPMEARASLRIEAARGVVGDRYSNDTGFFHGHPDHEVTLVELEDAREQGVEPLALRRNVVTSGVVLAELIGRAFTLGGATLHGMRACRPCGYLDNMLSRPELSSRLRGGLRARIVRGGDVRVGDAIAPAPVTLDEDMRAVVESAHLAFVATVTPDGRPNLSPKGTTRVLDAPAGVEGGRSVPARLFFLEIASQQTRKDILANPWMEVNVVDTTSRRGYRFFGRASLHQDDEVHHAAQERVFREDGARHANRGAIVLDVERVLPLVSPGYRHVPTEGAMREGWKEKRAALDAGFEAYLRAHGRI